MEKQASELTLPGAIEAYPGDPSLEVCPTRALEWDTKARAVTVLTDACIGCGLCASRCPYGAISLAGGSVAEVAMDDPDGLVTLGVTEATHPSPQLHGAIASTTAPAAEGLPASISKLSDTKSALLVRNLLNEVGMNARVRRRGDTNMRIDAIGYSRSERPFVAEIELSNAVLDSPRALLEDVAILHARYGYDISAIDPISIILAFPNVRSEYYQVIRDIDVVLGLKVRTITIGALISMMWAHEHIDGFLDELFFLGKETADLSDSLGESLKGVSEPYPGAFRPAK